jgi:biotin carboxylase
MKKLLILGANPETIPLIETAKSMSLYTIVTDPNPDAPAKKVADMSIDINGMDVQALVDFCKQENVDGVLVGVADRLIESYQKVCEALNLPCYSNQYQCEVLTNKKKFNNLCKENNITTIPSTLFYKEESIDNIKNINFPIFIKPVDSNSGKGMSLVYTKSELDKAIKKALANTKDDHILLERYMTCKDILVSYTIVNGEPILSAMADRHTTKEQNETSQVCLGATYPSSLLNTYMDKEHPKMIQMFKKIGLKNAILTISAFVENDNFYYYDPGFRLQGEAPNLHMENINGFDQKKFLIDIAMGNEISSNNVTKADFQNKHSSTIWFLLKKGKINKIEGFDIIKNDPSVFHISKRFSEHDVIDDNITGTEGQVLARVYLSCDSRESLKNKIIEIQNTIKVFDSDNNNQLLKGFVLN